TGKPIEIYPNPTRERLYISLGDTFGDVQLNLHRLDGQLVQQELLRTTQSRDVVLDLTQEMPGVYFIQFISEQNGVLTKRIVIQ
ncbi:MAG: T9SS type A sorting domain-containing protein, partial [Bacteroidota bacterium]